MNKKIQRKGFTLVEVIITMIIASIIAGIIVTFYVMQAKEVATSSTYAAINRGYEIFREELGRDIRIGKNIEIVTTDDEGVITAINIIKPDNQPSVRYEIFNDTLYRDEPPVDGIRTVFTVGANQTISVADENTKDEILSGFIVQLDNSVPTVTCYLTLTGNDGEDPITLPRREDFFKCRN